MKFQWNGWGNLINRMLHSQKLLFGQFNIIIMFLRIYNEKIFSRRKQLSGNKSILG